MNSKSDISNLKVLLKGACAAELKPLLTDLMNTRGCDRLRLEVEVARGSEARIEIVGFEKPVEEIAPSPETELDAPVHYRSTSAARLTLCGFTPPHCESVVTTFSPLAVTCEKCKAELEPGSLAALANEGDETELFGLENDFSVGTDGWVRLAPYGDHIKERLVQDADGKRRHEVLVQRLDKSAAQAMVDRFNSFWGKVKRFVIGVPIYKRHPDLADYAPETVATTLANDRTEYGMFAELQAREDGFYGRPVMTKAGHTAIENEGLKFLSPFWVGNITKEKKNGVQVFSPRWLVSAGLTDKPNIPGAEALANAKEQNEKDKIMDKKKLTTALIAAGIIALANDASDEQIIQAIQSLGQKASGATALENEKTQLTSAKGQLETQLQSEKTAREAAERERGEARTALANERKARIDLILDQAIAETRITPAQRPQWATELGKLEGTAFDQKVAALANEKPQLNTRAATGNLGARKSEADKSADAQQQVIALVNERYEKNPSAGYDAAWNSVRREKPELFELLKQPGQAQS